MRTRAILSATTLAASIGLAGIAGPATAAVPAPTPGTPAFALAHAKTAIAARAGLFAASGSDAFAGRNIKIDADGESHVHLNRTYQGVSVLGGDVIAHLTAAGSLTGVTRTQKSALTLSTTPGLTAAQATAKAAAALKGTGVLSRATLMVDAIEDSPVLVWKTAVLNEAEMTLTHVLVDANTGAVVDSWAEEQTVTGSGTGYYVGSVSLDTTLSSGTYQLKDPNRGNNYTVSMGNRYIGSGTLVTDSDNVWGTGTLANDQTLAVDAQFGVATTWDYYKNTFGRNGIADDGAGSYSRVHYGRSYDNAYWSDDCFCMTYGDGDGSSYGPFTSLDVAGHEMTHGVTANSAGLVYTGESGGLNEAMSDIFGTLVEFYAANSNDVADYLIGEELVIDGDPLRYMDDPSKDGSSAKCWSSTVKNLDVHYSSGVANHAFFLLAVGSGAHTVNGVSYSSPTCNSGTVTGIGNTAAGAIFYRALTTYMTSSTTFSGAKTATLSAAADLYGTSSTQYAQTAAAWAAVSVS
ncbi:M4 family metallopeptidase [Actinoplanes sp. NPDC051851]|uniref:M4 family metallopeptidase n=1 Tax=Actinoplanes sp. NPDC051851 TaxID=3154753 RepID=UPI0034302D1D